MHGQNETFGKEIQSLGGKKRQTQKQKGKTRNPRVKKYNNWTKYFKRILKVALPMQKKESTIWRVGNKKLPRETTTTKIKWKRVKKVYENNMHIMGIPEGEEIEEGTESIFKVTVAKNFPNLERV